MFRTHLFVSLSAVLQIVSVAVLHEALPLGSHVSRGLAEVIFRTKVVLVVGTVYLLNVIQKLFEWFSIAVLVDERRERLIVFVERLDAEEDVVGVAFYAC